ncbi:MAG TPA: maleylpyruvate isomerase family mycothiol-dependent enzyme [Streptosporangiaceae bacterium]|nr:maleylpyruvate isomerase family mycothiol-dependent enzyme [Streptosporangiaceae bacterium]
MSVGRRESAPATDRAGSPAKPAAYRHIRENVTRLVLEHRTAVGRIVPACPAWTVRDLVAHLTDNCLRAVRRAKGQEPAVEPPPSVEHTDVGELLAYWEKRAAELDRIVAAGDAEMRDLLVADAFTHEFDIRYALGAPLPAAHPAFPLVMAFGAEGITQALVAHGLPAFRIEVDGGSWVAGTGAPRATVRGHPYDVLRSLSGRRTYAQVAELSWSADPAPWLPALSWGPFTPPERPVERTALEMAAAAARDVAAAGA